MIGKTTAAMLQALEAGDINAETLVLKHLQRIKHLDEDLGAFLSLDEAGALAQARRVDEKRRRGQRLGALAGIPIAVKDNINIRGLITTCGSRMLEHFRSPYDATVIQKLRAADAVIVGKTNLDEFAMGSSTEYSALQKTRNPAHRDHVPGGSSGGSTAAVAAQMVPLALGSSTGGSIRQPAAFCGAVGMKPTYGAVSRYGLVAFGSSLDQIGPIAGDMDGAARLFSVIAGHDPRDATSDPRIQAPVCLASHSAPHPLRVGVVREFVNADLQPEIARALEQMIDLLKAQGVRVVTCSLPHTEYAIPAYYLLATAEASSNLARYDGARYGKRAQKVTNLKDLYTRSRSEAFGMEVKRRILLGTYCLSGGYYEGFYLKAQRARRRIAQDFQAAFGRVSILLAPTTPSTAFRFGENVDDPVSMYLNDFYTVMANLAGLPAISFPTGCDKKGLPIGLQLMANHFEEPHLFEAAHFMAQLWRESQHGKK